MSPVPANSLSSVANIGLKPQASELPVFHHWQNPLPDSFSELDNRKHILQAKNKFLEMHPSGVRAVDKKTKYCILMIMFLNISTMASETNKPLFAQWNAASADKQASRGTNTAPFQRIHVIISNETKMFLCMDDKSVVYQSSNYSQEHCSFVHEMDSEYRDRYFRKVNESTPAWYLGINRDGSIRCGNVTRKNQDSAKFNRIAVDQTGVSPSSPPFIEKKKECCTKSRCKNKSNSEAIVRDESKKCRRLRTRCKKQRRNVFKLSLKQLKKYYNKCVDSNSYFMKECRKISKSKTKNRRSKRNNRRHRTDAKQR